MRAASNTLLPYDENPPDLTLQDDEIVFLDLGPVFEEREADFGQTFVIGNDPFKKKLRGDIEKAFIEGKEYFKAHPDITAAELYRRRGFGGQVRMGVWRTDCRPLGRAIPARADPGDKVTLYIYPRNSRRMRDPGADGQPRHWILEIHFVDRARKIGGFYEQLLTVD